jgi:hypothetical protein
MHSSEGGSLVRCAWLRYWWLERHVECTQEGAIHEACAAPGSGIGGSERHVECTQEGAIHEACAAPG